MSTTQKDSSTASRDDKLLKIADQLQEWLDYNVRIYGRRYGVLGDNDLPDDMPVALPLNGPTQGMLKDWIKALRPEPCEMERISKEIRALINRYEDAGFSKSRLHIVMGESLFGDLWGEEKDFCGHYECTLSGTPINKSTFCDVLVSIVDDQEKWKDGWKLEVLEREDGWMSVKQAKPPQTGIYKVKGSCPTWGKPRNASTYCPWDNDKQVWEGMPKDMIDGITHWQLRGDSCCDEPKDQSIQSLIDAERRLRGFSDDAIADLRKDKWQNSWSLELAEDK